MAYAKSSKREATNSGVPIRNNIKTIEQLQTKVKNPQAKDALQQAIQVAEQSEATVASSFKEMSGRPGFLKFLIGADYKNAGQVRSEIIKLRNEIAQLTRTREEVSAGDQDAIDETIGLFQEQLMSIETDLSRQLEGFSLFGWLSRLLTGFKAPVATATPTVMPTETPVASPIETPVASPTSTLIN